MASKNGSPRASSSGSSTRVLSRSSSTGSSDGSGSGSSPRVRVTATEKLVDLKATAEEKITKASARLSEKAVLVRLNLALGLRRIIHHEQTPRHDKCLNYVAEAQTAATERRLRKEQEARERADWERAMAREWSLYKQSSKQHSHSHHHHSSSSSSPRKHLQQESHRNLVQGTA